MEALAGPSSPQREREVTETLLLLHLFIHIINMYRRTYCGMYLHCKKNLRDSCICFDQIFLGLGLGKFFLARESLVSDILAGDPKPFLKCTLVEIAYVKWRTFIVWKICCDFV